MNPIKLPMITIPIVAITGFPEGQEVSVALEDTGMWKRVGRFRYGETIIDFTTQICDFSHTPTRDLNIRCQVFRGCSNRWNLKGKVVTMLTLFYEIVDEEAYFGRYGCEGTTAAFSVHELEIMDIETYLQQHPNEKLQMASFSSQINTTNI